MNRLTLALIATLTASALHAQTAPTPAIAPPSLPFIVSYHYWPLQFVQFLGSELPYSMALLNVDAHNAKQPVLDFTLVDRAGKRIHYTNNDAVVAAVQAVGEEVHKTAMAYEPADNDNNGSITSVRFTMADGKPLQFRFVQGTDMSEQGSGLNPFPGTKIPIFAYRELGAVSAEGTALQIGDVASPVAPWPEISQPPYFVAYHAAATEGAHTLVFTPGKESWKITSSPSTLTAGAAWELDEANGNHRTVRIDKTDAAHFVFTITDSISPASQRILDATRTADGWTINRIRFEPLREGDKHVLTLDFATPLPSAGGNSTFSLIAGKKTTLATGALAASSGPGDETLTFTDPKWLSAVSMQEQAAVTPSSITVSAHP